MLSISPDRLGDVLDAVAARRAYPVAVELGVSTPALVQAALAAAADPHTYAAHPSACRRLLAGQEADRAARTAALLGVRCEV